MHKITTINGKPYIEVPGTHIQYAIQGRPKPGSTGVVFEGFYKDVPAAVKQVNSDMINIYKNELKIWKEAFLNAATEINIVRLFDWTVLGGEPANTDLYFAMELAESDLETRVKQFGNGKTSYESPEIQGEFLKLIEDSGKGLKWLHEHQIIHRDIKPQNILVFTTSNGKKIAKLGDFGISRKISSLGTGTNSMAKGTFDWMPPEAIRAIHNNQTEFRNSKKMDIFSFGMTAYFTLSCGNHPFVYPRGSHYGGDITSNIKAKKVSPKELASLEDCANHLFLWMMTKTERNRPTINQVLAHPLFWSVKYTLNFLKEVAIAFDKAQKDPQVKLVRDELDLRYQLMFKVKSAGSKFGDPHAQNRDRAYACFIKGIFLNWEKLLGTEAYILLGKRRSSDHIKNYDPTSVMSLVEMIRDKLSHKAEIKLELITDEYFGVDGKFDDEKFGNYILGRCPDLALFFFTELSDRKENFLGNLKKYFNLKYKVPLLKCLQHFDSFKAYINDLRISSQERADFFKKISSAVNEN